VRHFKILLVTFGVALFITSCTTFNGPTSYLEYPIPTGAKRSTQSSLFNKTMNTINEEEFFFDKKGHLIRSKRTEYIGNQTKNKHFIIWEAEWKVLGDLVVPSKVKCNGETYCEMEWQLLKTQHKGQIKMDIKSKYYTKKKSMVISTKLQFWRANLSEYPVPFQPDGKFIDKYYSYSYYGGRKQESVLSLGYNNVVLKKYSTSYMNYLKGVSQSFAYGSFKRNYIANLFKVGKVEFKYKWRVIAGKPCLLNMNFDAHLSGNTSNFTAKMSYNGQGKRKLEEWIVNEPQKDGTIKHIKVFEQKISY